jgi:hypothetical protein
MIYYEKPITGYKNLSEKQVDELQEVFSYGMCWVLAITLHRMFGYPISTIIDHDNYMEHAWVVKPNGMVLDIMGVHKTCDFGTATHTGMVEQEFLKSFKCASTASSMRTHISLTDVEFEHCKQVVEEYLIPTFELRSPNCLVLPIKPMKKQSVEIEGFSY